ncbi:MAG: transcriptional repressor [Lachnospiraceae bacterium]|nr:transcriptional repressor [Lachnospiraceae bacterium]
MNVKPKYRTRQREILMRYLETMPGVHITASDVCEHFREQGSSIGQSTVYRQLENLVSEGVLNKYIIDANSPACFEYVAEKDHCEDVYCFHCKCEVCGKLIHLHCDELSQIRGHLAKEHHFMLDPMRTVFYGICDSCSKAQEEGKEG